MNPQELGRKEGISDGMRKKGMRNTQEGTEERDPEGDHQEEISYFFLDTGRVFCYSFSLIAFD
jgi:hypothetical protein